MALEAVRLLHAAGVPEGALQLLHGPGDTVGAALVAAPGVVSTGSTQVAQIINRAGAAKDGPIRPLIAETGGINAMLVDSTALHEQIADHVIEMIQGAARELVCGDPSDLATDVGPVIDAQAFEVGAIADMQQEIFGPVLHIVRWSGDPSQCHAVWRLGDRVCKAAQNERWYHECFGKQGRLDVQPWEPHASNS